MAADPPGPGLGLGPGRGQENFNLGIYYQQQYQAAFNAALAAGEVKPLVIPWSFVGSFFLPLVYLVIPHTNRPWLYRMRWAVAAAVVYLNVRLMQTTSAGNEAVAYTTGLVAVWGTIWALRLLIFTRPQWEAARVEWRPRLGGKGLAGGKKKATVMTPPDESVAAALPHHEYFWQPFPATAPLLTRLGWTADLLTASRGAGWNFAIPSIPHPPPPSKRLEGGEPVRLDLIPLTSRAGTARSPTYASFLRSRLVEFTLAYLTIDLLTTTIRRDPYFVLGPDYASQGYALPALYADILPCPGYTVPVLRNVAALAGIIAGLHLYYSVLQLAIVFPLRGVFGVRAELWQHPALFGGFVPSVLDRGLAGFWGGWWHQTFRAGFVAPASWVLRGHSHGHHHHAKVKGEGGKRDSKILQSVVELLLAFSLSGILHAAGSHTSVPRTTRPWTPVTFFLLQAVGIILQTAASALFSRRIQHTGRKIPQWLRRTTNLLLILLYLHLTAYNLIDDMSRAGIWLFEPVPVSPLRMMGLGQPGDAGVWWRWGGGEYGLRLYSGVSWWDGGVRL
ncbi:membrane bound O-acyl transferase family-domain-containing protein [Parachaetomium inaequale]|uniref:Membrane bound O-acyl transferase family-domain-containing protein n=1 Tax=Parachaetomium inaequale TaxID=2588326 RepID=A0AAN6SUG8_9PEZI|nr:membrane bound O-acyl transferase family-domain-containing protein [Parachaetomium inaequale]